MNEGGVPMPPQQQPAALRLLKGRGHGTDSGGRRGVDAAADAAQMVDVVASWDHTDEDPVGKAMCC
jgi:phage terminase small subunit